jgi:YHS domain-containing protein
MRRIVRRRPEARSPSSTLTTPPAGRAARRERLEPRAGPGWPGGSKLGAAAEPVEFAFETDRTLAKGESMASAKDPVCGMEVSKDTELKTEHDGETYYFCSRGCKLDFEEDPEKYLDPEYEPHM